LHPPFSVAGRALDAGFLVAALRVALYRRGVLGSSRPRGPVISVGNLSVGGSGKTPLVARIAELAAEASLPVAVLSRGYRGAFRGEALIVSDGERVLCGAAEAGDEAVMLARLLRGAVVAVGRRRDRVARAVESRFGPRLHLLDDGFQHLRLQRDLDLLCVDPADLEDRPLPAGRLREAHILPGRKRRDDRKDDRERSVAEPDRRAHYWDRDDRECDALGEVGQRQRGDGR